MFNTNDILARLKAGESAEVIAKEMTDALNKATETYEAEKAMGDKIAAVRDVIKALNHYISISQPEVAKTFKTEFTDDECIHYANQLDNTIVTFHKVITLMEQEPVTINFTAPISKAKPKTATDPDEVFKNFFRNIGI